MRHRIVIAAVIALSLLACAKKRPGETPQESVARKKAVYSAQSVTALQGWADITGVLARNGVVAEASAKAIYAANEKALTALDLVRKRLREGFPSKDVLPVIETILADLDAAEAGGLIGLSDPEAQAKFQQAIFSVRFTLNSIKAILAATKEPSIVEARDTARQAVRLQATRQPGWWTEAVLVAQVTVIKMLEQSRMDAAEAWADADRISADLHSANMERLR